MLLKPAFDPWLAGMGSHHTIKENAREAKQAAQQFEALLVRQFLSSARSNPSFGDQNELESGWREIADDALAGYVVRAGGLGLSKQVETMLNQASVARTGR